MFVKPAPGALVRDPDSKRALPESGSTVPDSTYWLRRLAAGEIVVVQPITDSEAAESAKGA